MPLFEITIKKLLPYGSGSYIMQALVRHFATMGADIKLYSQQHLNINPDLCQFSLCMLAPVSTVEIYLDTQNHETLIYRISLFRTRVAALVLLLSFFSICSWKQPEAPPFYLVMFLPMLMYVLVWLITFIRFSLFAESIISRNVNKINHNVQKAVLTSDWSLSIPPKKPSDPTDPYKKETPP